MKQKKTDKSDTYHLAYRANRSVFSHFTRLQMHTRFRYPLSVLMCFTLVIRAIYSIHSECHLNRVFAGSASNNSDFCTSQTNARNQINMFNWVHHHDAGMDERWNCVTWINAMQVNEVKGLPNTKQNNNENLLSSRISFHNMYLYIYICRYYIFRRAILLQTSDAAKISNAIKFAEKREQPFYEWCNYYSRSWLHRPNLYADNFYCFTFWRRMWCADFAIHISI